MRENSKGGAIHCKGQFLVRNTWHRFLVLPRPKNRKLIFSFLSTAKDDHVHTQISFYHYNTLLSGSQV